MRMAVFALFAFAVPVAADAQPQAMAPAATPSSLCLRQNMVYGWQVVNDQTLIVTDRVQKKYVVSLKPGCFELKWPMRLSFRSFSGFGLSCLTRNDYVMVPPQAGLPPQRCLISAIAAYGPPPN